MKAHTTKPLSIRFESLYTTLAVILLLSPALHSQVTEVHIDSLSMQKIAKKEEARLKKRIDRLEQEGNNLTLIADAKMNLAIQYMTYIKDLESAQTTLNEVFTIMYSTDLKAQYARALTLQGRLQVQNQEYTKSIETQFKAIRYREAIDNPNSSINY